MKEKKKRVIKHKLLDCRSAMVVLIIILFLVVLDRTSESMFPRAVEECLSSADCPTGYLCYNSQLCFPSPSGPLCGDQAGDLKCHKVCNTNADCAGSEEGEVCESIALWSGETGSVVSMCLGGDCQSYCLMQPHIECVGHWEIFGTYPDCNCKFVCEMG
jgi:hypothetical protein